MQQSPLKDKDLGVIVGGYDETKFAEVRQKAKEEYIQRKTKHRKDKLTPVPEAYPGEIVVITYARFRKTPQYYLFEILDFMLSYDDKFKYFGILLKTTDKDGLNNIGRIDTFCGSEHHWMFDKQLTKLKKDNIKWLE
jgi:hypothetical protein